MIVTVYSVTTEGHANDFSKISIPRGLENDVKDFT